MDIDPATLIRALRKQSTLCQKAMETSPNTAVLTGNYTAAIVLNSLAAAIGEATIDSIREGTDRLWVSSLQDAAPTPTLETSSTNEASPSPN